MEGATETKAPEEPSEDATQYEEGTSIKVPVQNQTDSAPSDGFTAELLGSATGRRTDGNPDSPGEQSGPPCL